MSSEKILIVEDEPAIVQLAQLYFNKEGFEISVASDGKQAIDMAVKENPVVIMLDIMLPIIDGLEVCRQLRAMDHSAAIIMVTARDEDIDKIIGLELGADDYLTKPFNPRELVARVRAILRRDERRQKMNQDSAIIIGEIEIHPGRREVKVQGQPINIRAQEFDLLLTMANQPGIVLSREKLLLQAWGFDYPGQTRTVDVHIAQLRKKLGSASEQIETVSGVGYRLVG